MAEPAQPAPASPEGDGARQIDRIDAGPRHTQADAARLNAMFSGRDTQAMLAALIRHDMLGSAAVVSSFGAESAVLLHLIAQIDPAVPVLFLDTGKHFPETLAYRDRLAALLGLSDLRSITPDPAQIAARDVAGERWSYDPDGCCDIRKVQPLGRALAGFDAQFTGRKAFQAATRAALPRFEIDDGRLKVNPLADWTKADIDGYMAAHNLPAHPLVAAGYLSIGCAPCTAAVAPGADPRSGRWQGFDKVECGIHQPAGISQPAAAQGRADADG